MSSFVGRDYKIYVDNVAYRPGLLEGYYWDSNNKITISQDYSRVSNVRIYGTSTAYVSNFYTFSNADVGKTFHFKFNYGLTFGSRVGIVMLKAVAGTFIDFEDFTCVSLTGGTADFLYECTHAGPFYLGLYADWVYTQEGSSSTVPSLDWSLSSPPVFNLSVSEYDPVKSYDVQYNESDYVYNEETGGYDKVEKTETDENPTEGSIVSKIINSILSIPDKIVNGIAALFIPSSAEMADLFEQLNQFFSDTFGFLYAPFDYLIQLIGVFTSSTGTTGLTLPGFSIMGHEVWPDLSYNIADNEVANSVLGFVRIGTGVLLAGWFIMYLQDFFKERFGGGGS